MLGVHSVCHHASFDWGSVAATSQASDGSVSVWTVSGSPTQRPSRQLRNAPHSALPVHATNPVSLPPPLVTFPPQPTAAADITSAATRLCLIIGRSPLDRSLRVRRASARRRT